MDAATRATIEQWVADPEVDDAARALLLLTLDAPPQPTLLSREDAAALADMRHRENAAAIATALATDALERDAPMRASSEISIAPIGPNADTPNAPDTP